MILIRVILSFFLLVSFAGCKEEQAVLATSDNSEIRKNPYILILGTTQDAGAPQLGCAKECCTGKFNSANRQRVVSLALIDETTKSWWLFEASPDITSQISLVTARGMPAKPNGVFLTHAHIGHYTGLMYFGREAMSTSKLPVYVMPRMREFLSTNGPWSQLVSLENIFLKTIKSDSVIRLNSKLAVIPFLVPHRDEWSETVGYRIQSQNSSALFIPDIDKWGKWESAISEVVKTVDYAFLDGTFYNGDELPGRDINAVPHPFIVESFKEFESLTPQQKGIIQFIHFNHTNPLLNSESEYTLEVLKKGFGIARSGSVYGL